MVGGFERRGEGAKFVEETAESPDVGFFVVFFFDDLFGGHVVGGADFGFGEVFVEVEDFGEAEVTELYVVVGVEEDVGGFEVAVEDFAVLAGVDFVESEDYLHEPFPD